jgi:hypothetical protein
MGSGQLTFVFEETLVQANNIGANFSVNYSKTY